MVMALMDENRPAREVNGFLVKGNHILLAKGRKVSFVKKRARAGHGRPAIGASEGTPSHHTEVRYHGSR